MKLYTSYFANLKKLPEDIVPIAIAGKLPEWYKGLRYKPLAPKFEDFQWWLLTHDEGEYTKRYYENILNKLDPSVVVTKFIALSGGKDVALICYEKSGDFCHRHIVAEWLTKYGAPCVEWTPSNVKDNSNNNSKKE